MKKEFQITQEELDHIKSINEGFNYFGLSLMNPAQIKTDDYWKKLGEKYGFNSKTVERTSKSELIFLAEPTK